MANDTPGTASYIQESIKGKVLHSSHPLDPLSPDEILQVSSAIRKHVAVNTSIKAIRFITCALLPPPKKDVLAALGIKLAPGSEPEAPKPFLRRAESDFMDVVTGHTQNATLHFEKEAGWIIDSLDQLPEGVEPQITVEELTDAEVIVKADLRVQQLAKEVGVEPHQIFADGWSIGYDERFPKSKRIQQALLFARFSEHDNLYAHPLDFVPIIDALERKVLHIDFAPHYKPGPNETAILTTADGTGLPPPLDDDALKHSGRERLPPPRRAYDFLPDLMATTDEDGFEPRKDLKPLHIIQPEGVSFKMNGHEIEWQKWKLHVAFGHREGIVLSTVTYNDGGEVRPIFYRLSLAEMVVPYGAPEFPHPRKFAFDSGEYGMGTMANELALGCDCLGQIHYLPGSYIAQDGSAVVIKNVICIHEEDAGVLWKHTDYRPGGRSQTVRSRRLVISMVCTLANYEYIWNYHFYQDGNIEFEIKLTGILQTYVSADNEPIQFGTTVAPNITAHYHQHIFSLRVDPMIDGLYNSVQQQDIIPLPNAPTGSPQNYAGNAFVTDTKILERQSEGGCKWDAEKDRRWSIINTSRKHHASGKNAGYSIMMRGANVPLLANPDGWAAKRSSFPANALWVIKDVEDGKGGRMWPSGKYVPQTRDEPADSVGGWVKANGEDNIKDEDLVVFITVGVNHIPRPEDWPVMPSEKLSVMFKPSNFFKMNPSMDVPGSKDTKSVAAFPHQTNGVNGTHTNGVVTNGNCCA